MTGLALPRRDWFLLISGSILLFFAYPPFHLLIPSFVCLAPVVAALGDAERDGRPLRRHLAQGFWFGILSSAALLYWMPIALNRVNPVFLAGYPLALLVLGAHGAIAFGLVGWLTRWTGITVVTVFPFVWTASEWLIAHQGAVRFPWLGLGTSLTGYVTLVQIADVVGARGVTFLLAMANAALGVAWTRRKHPRRSARLFVPVLLGVLAAYVYGTVRAEVVAMRSAGTVAAVQSNVSYRAEPSPAARESSLRHMVALSERGAFRSDAGLLVWPESAVLGYFHATPDASRAIAELAGRLGKPVLVGGEDREPLPGRGVTRFNAAFLFDTGGHGGGPRVYRKRRLVPLVERMPLVGRLRTRVAAFQAGNAAPVFEAASARFGVLICFEAAFEELAREYRRRGAELVVNITNDAWIVGTLGVEQHLAHIVMRAIENRIGAVRVANAGVSVFVDPVGRSLRMDAGLETVASREVFTVDRLPPYTWLGDWVGWGALLGTAILFGLAVTRSRTSPC